MSGKQNDLGPVDLDALGTRLGNVERELMAILHTLPSSSPTDTARRTSRQPARDGDPSLTVCDVAKILGLSESRVRSLVREGVLSARQGPGGRLWVSGCETLQLYKLRRQRAD